MPVQIDTSIPCVECDYSLKGLPFNGKCPECGHEVGHSVLEADPQLAAELQERADREMYEAQNTEFERQQQETARQQQETARQTEEWSRQLKVRESLLAREQQLIERTGRMLETWEQLSLRIQKIVARFESNR